MIWGVKTPIFGNTHIVRWCSSEIMFLRPIRSTDLNPCCVTFFTVGQVAETIAMFSHVQCSGWGEYVFILNSLLWGYQAGAELRLAASTSDFHNKKASLNQGIVPTQHQKKTTILSLTLFSTSYSIAWTKYWHNSLDKWPCETVELREHPFTEDFFRDSSKHHDWIHSETAFACRKPENLMYHNIHINK